jgi:acetyl esterase/lipase
MKDRVCKRGVETMDNKNLQVQDDTSVTEPINGYDQQLSEYKAHYSQFVDSKEPLKVLEERDWTARTNAFSTHRLLAQNPSPDRVDYLDISYGSDPLQKLDIHHKKGSQSRPVIFFIHGGGWVMGDKNFSMFAAPSWVDLGYTVVSVNYRLAPNFKHPAQIEDCAIALRWVFDNIHNYYGNPNEIAVIGHSAGSHLAALLITDKRWKSKYNLDIGKIRCWILMSGIYDLTLNENYLHPMMKGFIDAFIDSEDKKRMHRP